MGPDLAHREVLAAPRAACARSMRGAPPKAIQELAGHADLTMTQRYMHLSPAALDAAIGLLDRPSGDQSCGRYVGNGGPAAKMINESGGITGGEAGIRTLGRAFRPYNGLANRRLQPLGHLTLRVDSSLRASRARKPSIRHALLTRNRLVPVFVPKNCPCRSLSGARAETGKSRTPSTTAIGHR